MPSAITLPIGEHDYELLATFANVEYTLRLRWNARAAAWYLDLTDPDGEPVVTGIKCVLGVKLGGRSAHPFFDDNILILTNIGPTSVDPGIDDLGRRVQLVWLGAADISMIVADGAA